MTNPDRSFPALEVREADQLARTARLKGAPKYSTPTVHGRKRMKRAQPRFRLWRKRP